MVATLYDASLDAFRTHGWSASFFPLKTLSTICMESFPDNLITAMAEIPCAVARATMVSLIFHFFATKTQRHKVIFKVHIIICLMLNHVVSAAENFFATKTRRVFFSVSLICPAPNLFICISFWPRRHKEFFERISLEANA